VLASNVVLQGVLPGVEVAAQLAPEFDLFEVVGVSVKPATVKFSSWLYLRHNGLP